MATADFGFWVSVAVGIRSYIDGSWLDIGSFLFSLFYVRWQWSKRPEKVRGPFLCRDMGLEFANAASIFPLLLLTLSIFSSKLTAALVSGNKIILSIAGGFALFALLEDRGPRHTNEGVDFVGPIQPAAAANGTASQPNSGPQKPSQRAAGKARRVRKR